MLCLYEHVLNKICAGHTNALYIDILMFLMFEKKEENLFFYCFQVKKNK